MANLYLIADARTGTKLDTVRSDDFDLHAAVNDNGGNEIVVLDQSDGMRLVGYGHAVGTRVTEDGEVFYSAAWLDAVSDKLRELDPR